MVLHLVYFKQFFKRQELKKKEKWIFKLTHVNDKNRAIHKWDLVDILQEKKENINLKP